VRSKAQLEGVDAVALDEWHVVAAVESLPIGVGFDVGLLGARVVLERAADGTITARRDDGVLPAFQRFGYVWTTLGAPRRELFEIAEVAEPDRRNLHTASLGVHVSAPRAIENFLDLGHFPFVHPGLLGSEPYTEVKPYDVTVTFEGGVTATRCRFYQPRSAAFATEGFEVEYVYRVPHPYCSVLYKRNPEFTERMDVIALFVQPVTEERIRAHLFVSLLDRVSTDAEIRSFQQTIFAQDKPILENQRPKRLPLDPHAELPTRADASSLAYRSWLRDRDVRYGTIPADR
jgi:phenylpropionate dioxygenase-like ring-hydroxylating dioxygenase large terminal subunit